MSFDCDAFISYSHIDNVVRIEGRSGWISNFHRALEGRVAQLLGEQPRFWRDPKLAGNDIFEQTLVDQLQKVAVLITIVSPRYVRSEWTRRELVEFWKAAEGQGGVSVHDKARIFKVLKTPVSRSMEMPELQQLLGYEFFNINPETGRVEELDEAFGAHAQVEFWKKLNDLAYDVADLLGVLRSPGLEASSEVRSEDKGCVFLAESTADLREVREALRRELQQHGYRVLPARGLPLVASEMTASLKDDLDQCRMSIHPIGRNYGLIPEGSSVSLQEIENELAIERGKRGEFVRLTWIPAGLQVEDPRQVKLIQELRTDPRLQAGSDLLETAFEELKTVVHERLRRPASSQRAEAYEGVASRGYVYFIYDERDNAIVAPYADATFEEGLEVLYPTFEGDEADLRQCHEENLRVCTAAIIVFGSANESWVRRKLREIQKSVGYGRTGPLPEVAVLCVGAKTAEKERFRTHEATVISQKDGFSTEPLRSLWLRARA